MLVTSKRAPNHEIRDHLSVTKFFVVKVSFVMGKRDFAFQLTFLFHFEESSQFGYLN